MTPRLFPLSLAVLLFLSACAGSRKAGDAAPPAPPPAEATKTARAAPAETPRVLEPPAAPTAAGVAALIRRAFNPNIQLTRGDVYRRFGPPRRAEAEPIPNEHRPLQTDTLRTLFYDGLELVLYESARPPKSFCVRIALTDDQYASPEGLRVGDARAYVLDQLGDPTERDGEYYFYEETSTTPTALALFMQNDRVARIEWLFYYN